MDAILTWIHNNGTKFLAMLVGTLAIVAQSPNIIPEASMKWILLAIAVLTYWRGQANTDAIAATVTQQHVDAIAKAVATGTAPVIAPPGNLAPAQKDPTP